MLENWSKGSASAIIYTTILSSQYSMLWLIKRQTILYYITIFKNLLMEFYLYFILLVLLQIIGNCSRMWQYINIGKQIKCPMHWLMLLLWTAELPLFWRINKTVGLLHFSVAHHPQWAFKSFSDLNPTENFWDKQHFSLAWRIFFHNKPNSSMTFA